MDLFLLHHAKQPDSGYISSRWASSPRIGLQISLSVRKRKKKREREEAPARRQLGPSGTVEMCGPHTGQIRSPSQRYKLPRRHRWGPRSVQSTPLFPPNQVYYYSVLPELLMSRAHLQVYPAHFRPHVGPTNSGARG